jgi:hypothetical protein
MKTDIHEKESRSEYHNSPQAGGKPGTSQKNPGKDETVKKIQAAGKPGPGHRVLAALLGDWRAEVKCMMDPADPPTVSQATASTSWILDGRFLEEEFHGEMMGQPFTGRCLMGYDNAKQKFNCVWVDSANTAMFTSEGKGDSQTITLEGRADCAATGEKDVLMKQVYHLHSPDKHVLEMFAGGKKSMEIAYSRR